jgi:Ras-related C3 botulinum toxin substrate 1
VVDGSGAVGKTCLLIRYTTNAFPTEYIPTVYDNYNAEILVDGRTVHFFLWDYPQREDSDRLRPLFYLHTSVFLVCYALDSPSSFKSAEEKWIATMRHLCPDIPIVLCCTKIDLLDDESQKEKIVPESEGLVMQERLRLAGFVTCSALTGKGVKEAFDLCIRLGCAHPAKQPKQKTCELL